MAEASVDDRLMELLAEWEERQLDERPMTAEQVCRQHPELLPQLRQAIEKLGQVDALLRIPSADNSSTERALGARHELELTLAPPAERRADAANEATSGTQSSSTSLIVRLQARDSDAWQRFTLIYGPLVYSWARAAGLRDADSADVGQDVFQAVSVHIDDFRRDRPGDSLRGWIWTIARNKIREHFRRSSKRPEAKFGDQGLADVAEAPEDEPANDAETTQLAQRALDLIRTDFEPRTWQAFWRTAVEGQCPSDVAQDLGLSVAAVYMARSRILARLRQELGEFSR